MSNKKSDNSRKRKRVIKDISKSDSGSDTDENKESNDPWVDFRFTKNDMKKMHKMIDKYKKPKDRKKSKFQKTDNCKKNEISKNEEKESLTNRNTITTRSKSRLQVNKDILSNQGGTNINQENDEKEDDEKEEINNKRIGWVSATKTKNYLLNDKAVDWLSYYYDKYGIHSKELTIEQLEENKKLMKDASHLDILFEGGNTFEKKIYEELSIVYGNDFVIAFNEDDMEKFLKNHDIDGIIREKNKYVKTLMNKGIPIIAQAPLINDNNCTYGIADLLIRSDYLEVIFNIFIPDDDIKIKAPLLTIKKGSYHYRVIDCKWTTMTLNVDEMTMRNEGLFPAYKGQLAVYTAALENLQGYVPNYAYIMAKAWKIGKTNIHPIDADIYRGYSSFDRPGVIDYKKKDRNFLSKTKEAIMWVQEVMTEGRQWRYDIDKPSVYSLYPNMNKKSSNPIYDKIKEKLAYRYGDPTLVWYVNTKNRENAHKEGIYDVRNPECTLKTLGIKAQGRGPTIEKIIDINKYNQKETIRPKKIKLNTNNWQTEHDLDYVVDFETINFNLYANPNNMDIDNSYFGSDVTFMIGFGFNHDPNLNTNVIIDALEIDKSKCNCYVNIDKINGWEFVCLYLTSFKLKNEMEMYRLFFQFILIREEIFKGSMINTNKSKNIMTRLFHWTAAEIRFMKRGVDRMKSGEYAKYIMENENMNFCNKSGKQISEKEFQLELNNLIDVFYGHTIWVDMCKIFEKEPIVIKGSFRFKLKHIGNAFHENGFIDTKWTDGRMSDGFRAMLEAIKLYREYKTLTHENKLYKEIIDYNEIDCRVIWEIVAYLRAHHCG